MQGTLLSRLRVQSRMIHSATECSSDLLIGHTVEDFPGCVKPAPPNFRFVIVVLSILKSGANLLNAGRESVQQVLVLLLQRSELAPLLVRAKERRQDPGCRVIHSVRRRGPGRVNVLTVEAACRPQLPLPAGRRVLTVKATSGPKLPWTARRRFQALITCFWRKSMAKGLFGELVESFVTFF